ncbi:MAG: sulfite exporter TauE/SafE family protein [Pseudohongiella sp.]|nr:sulfite exporter TauE/SafE family protein [Pseudohongiella sp.]
MNAALVGSGGALTGELISAFALGLFSAPHCLAMCGGIASALLMSGRTELIATRQKPTRALASTPGLIASSAAPAPLPAPGLTRPLVGDALVYGSGKILGYMALGLIAGAGGFLLGGMNSAAFVMLRALSGILLIALGLYMAGWWLGVLSLERWAYRLWQPVLRRVQHLSLRHTSNKLLAGIAWGLLPCGIVYSVLSLALASGSAINGLLIMMVFGLGTLPFVLLSGGLLQFMLPLLKMTWIRQSAGLGMIGLGAWTLVNNLG